MTSPRTGWCPSSNSLLWVELEGTIHAAADQVIGIVSEPHACRQRCMVIEHTQFLPLFAQVYSVTETDTNQLSGLGYYRDRTAYDFLC